MRTSWWGVLVPAVLVLGLLLSGQAAWALVNGGAAQTELLKYEVFVKKFEVSYDNGATWTTVFEGTSTLVDLAKGESAGTFFSNQSVPVGTINRVRVTIDQSMTIKGKVSNGGTTYVTTATGAAEQTMEVQGATYADQATNVPTGDIVHEQAVNVSVEPGQDVTLQVTLGITNADNAIGVQSCSPCGWSYFVVPQEVTATVTQL